MKTSSLLPRFAAFALASLVALVAFTLPAAAQQADFTTFVQIGDSLTHGYTDGCVVEYAQRDSVGAIIARQAGVTNFEQALIKAPGLGPCMVLTSLAPTFGYRPNTGTPLNATLSRPYNNLGISGFTISQAVDSNPATPAGGIAFTVLRGQGTMLQQAAALKPTFLTIWIGNNDSLNAVGLGTVIDGVTLTPKAVFDSKLQTIVDTMKTAQGGTGKGVILNMGDVAGIPFATTVPAILGTNPATGAPIYAYYNGCAAGVPAALCSVPAGSLLTLYAAQLLQQGYGIPCQLLDAAGAPAADPRRANCLVFSATTGAIVSGKQLPDNCDLSGGPASCSARPGVVLTPTELTLLRGRVAEYNASIASMGPAAGYKVFDIAAWQKDLLAHPKVFAGMTVSTAYLSGGFVGYDGIHPTSIGYALIARDLIAFINANYGNSIPDVDMSPFLTRGNTSPG
ncbi:MAG TPA: hypothetical protein VLH41_05475, partial [Thermoanaerobaculia bacterium]|nr:hypothetical protein [Thermoanaerobaculia bacterium]